VCKKNSVESVESGGSVKNNSEESVEGGGWRV